MSWASSCPAVPSGQARWGNSEEDSGQKRRAREDVQREEARDGDEGSGGRSWVLKEGAHRHMHPSMQTTAQPSNGHRRLWGDLKIIV